LQGFDPEAMQRLVDPIDEEEHALQLIHDSMMRVMNRARAIATPTQLGSQALFEVQRKEWTRSHGGLSITGSRMIRGRVTRRYGLNWYIIYTVPRKC
jgi:hypothetical protein